MEFIVFKAERRMTEREVYTIGHSNLSADEFCRRLSMIGATAVADVRSHPVSRWLPHFNREELRHLLKRNDVAYVFLGEELGGRPKLPSLYSKGIADYEAMARTMDFRRGLERVIEGSLTHRIVLMCSEHEPLDCHRCLLVGRALADAGKKVRHVTGPSSVEEHSSTEDRLLAYAGVAAGDLFLSHHERLALAYRERAMQVAYSGQSETSG